MRRLALGLFVLVMACQKSPSGRRQLILVSDSQMAEMGTQAFEQMKAMTPSTTNAFVQCVAQAITALPEVQKFSSTGWEIVVFDEPQTVNAFALPGGKIGVYTGILQVTTTQGELAAVLGHEVSHVLSRHSAERVTEDSALNLGVTAISSIFSNPTTRNIAVGALGIGSQVGIVLPFSRTQEAEADDLGQKLMAEAGFDPEEAVNLWVKMAMLGGTSTPAILSDHPDDASRQKDLMNRLPQTKPLYDRARAAGLMPNCQM
jgi:predicted Zn-dependent protease